MWIWYVPSPKYLMLISEIRFLRVYVVFTHWPNIKSALIGYLSLPNKPPQSRKYSTLYAPTTSEMNPHRRDHPQSNCPYHIMLNESHNQSTKPIFNCQVTPKTLTGITCYTHLIFRFFILHKPYNIWNYVPGS